jgi:hypothetical protein
MSYRLLNPAVEAGGTLRCLFIIQHPDKVKRKKCKSNKKDENFDTILYVAALCPEYILDFFLAPPQSFCFCFLFVHVYF